MTKKEIVKAISEKVGLTQLQTKEVVQMTFDAIVDTLAAGERIELRNFGVFEVKKRVAERTDHTVNFTELYAGSAVKVTETLEGVQNGVVDIGGMCCEKSGRRNGRRVHGGVVGARSAEQETRSLRRAACQGRGSRSERAMGSGGA